MSAVNDFNNLRDSRNALVSGLNRMDEARYDDRDGVINLPQDVKDQHAIQYPIFEDALDEINYILEGYDFS